MNQLMIGQQIMSVGKDSAYDKWTRKTTAAWVNVDILNSKPRSYNTGLKLDTITLNGRAFGSKGMALLNAFRELCKTREPQVVVDGAGANMGRWKVLNVTEQQTKVIDDGTAMVIDFTLTLEEFSDG